MKRFLSIALSIAFVAVLFSACSGSQDVSKIKDVDVDLTSLNSNLIYSEVYNMLTTPDDYVGKRVKIKGNFQVYDGEGDKMYFACVIPDATACCQQGLEFKTKKELQYPDDYPDTDTEITVVGTFSTYNEGDLQYVELVDSVMQPVEAA